MELQTKVLISAPENFDLFSRLDSIRSLKINLTIFLL